MEYEGIGDNYQQITKYKRGAMPRHGLDWSAQPSLKKPLADAIEIIELPSPASKGGPPIWDVIRLRRSLRAFNRESLSGEELAQLLWATQGTTLEASGYKFRAAPSAGALYPVETYIVANSVDGLKPGVYHYDALDANLQLLQEGAFGGKAAAAALDQPMVQDAAVVFIWTAIVERAKWKYMERAYRYIYLDAGHIGQNLYLAATALGLGCCAIGALYDEEVNELVGADGMEETAVYMCAVGRLSY